MAIDFNVDPFFDDYSEDKKFYRILFRPGYAVQARELTQLQTILQQQIKRHGDHMFKNGSMVIPGQVAFDTDVFFVKVVNKDNIDIEFNTVLGKTIQNSNGLLATVIDYRLAEGADEDTLFVRYLNTYVDETGENVKEFSIYDVLTPTDETLTASFTVADTFMPLGNAATASIKRGVYYVNNHFVLVEDQTIILDKYSNTPSYKVGLVMEETTVYPEEDESLLDNALGSPNYAAPGAARFYISLTLTKVGLLEDDPEGFFELMRLENGITVFKIDRTQYAEIEKTLARRTYDESGDYTLSPFPVSARHYRNNFRGDWAANEKFIQGDIIRTTIGTSPDYYYFTATIAGISTTSESSKPAFDPDAEFIQDNQVRWEYTPIPNFNQGVYSFNSGDPLYSAFTLNDHIRLEGMLAIGVEAGKAYVRGYEINKLTTQYNPSFKSRDLPAGSKALADYLNAPASSRIDGTLDTGLPAVNNPVSTTKTINIDTSMGSYVLIKDPLYVPDISECSQVNLYGVVKSSVGALTAFIGKARVRGFEYHDTIESVRVYKLFLFDIQMNSGSFFNEVRAIGSNIPGSFLCNTYDDAGATTLLNPENSSLLFDLPDYAVKEIVSMDYTVVAPFITTSSGTTITINAPGGYTFEPTGVITNYVIFAIDTTVVTAGSIIPNSSLTMTLSNVNQTLTITSGSVNVESNKQYRIFATLKRSNVNPDDAVSPIEIVDQTESFTTEAIVRSTKIVLQRPYITRIVSIKMASAGFGSQVYDIDITNRYFFDSGQTRTSIDKGSIILQDGAPTPSGPIQVKYEYVDLFSSLSDGNVLGVNSYVADNSGMRYDQIPIVGTTFLRDAIDFRPYAGLSNYEAKWFPKFGETTTVEYNNYLPRTDNISLSPDGDYIIRSGTPGLNPVEPETPATCMKLARIYIEPYTFRVDQESIRIDRVENKRYTMRDIGKLERRIEDLEYYTSLTLLEMDTNNLKIIDSNGLERFQNGFLVDRFDDQGVGNAASPDWNASIDSNDRILRPFHNDTDVPLLHFVDAENANYKLTGDIITLNYTEVLDKNLYQPRASLSESVNPFEIYTWKGTLTLTPWQDTWFATERRPDIIINDEGQYNAVVAKAEADGVLGTIWDSWRTVASSVRSLGTTTQTLNAWSRANTAILNDSNNGGSFWRARSSFTADELVAIGVNPALAGNQSALGRIGGGIPGLRVLTIETSAVETTRTREGINRFVVDKWDSRVIDDRVVDTQIVPFIRPRAVLIRGGGYKPKTRLYNFFDGVNVDDYVTSAIRMRFTQVTGYHDKFTTTKNCGSKVEDPERLVTYNTGLFITGTVTVTNGSNQVVGFATSFLGEIEAGDKVFVGTDAYIVASIQDNTHLTLKSNYLGTTDEGIALSVVSAKHSNAQVELAFSHGEVIKEYVNGVATGRSAIVIGQETYQGKRYVWVLNDKGDGKFSTATNSYWEGEYTEVNNSKPRIKYDGEIHRPKYVESSFTGMVMGIFRIPNNPILKFKTGDRQYRLSDDPNNIPAKESTSGFATYVANGLVEIKQRTILSTRTAEIASESVSSGNQTFVSSPTRNTVDDSGWFDPLAQTFLVQQDGGIFVTSVDLFFQKKPVSEGAEPPATLKVQIREVVNGYPGQVVVPFSRVEVAAADINVDSEQGLVATNIKFEAPVYLQNGEEYALVILSDDANYRLWISQTDTIDVVSDTRITSQPFQGVLFKSQNASTWTADQTQDLKFSIYRAEFTSSSAEVQFVPPSNPLTDLSFNPFSFVASRTQFRVQHLNHGFRSLDLVSFTNRQITTFINGIPVGYLFNIPLSVSSVELDSYIIDLTSSLPKSSTQLDIEFGEKTFDTFTNYSKEKFEAFTAGTTVIRFVKYDTVGNAIYPEHYMEGTIESIDDTSITIDVTTTGSGTGNLGPSDVWLLSSTSTGPVGGSFISATRNIQYQHAQVKMNTNVLPGTDATYKIRTLALNEEEITNDVILYENLNFDREMILPNSDNYIPADLPLLFTAKLTTTMSNISPVIDLAAASTTLVNNKVDRVNASINYGNLDAETIASGIEMGGEEDNKDVIISVDGNTATITVSALDDIDLYNDFNRLRIGNVCQFTYSLNTGSYYQVVTNKYLDSEGNLILEFEPEVNPNTNQYDSPIQATTTNTVSIFWLTHYISEYAPYGSTTKAKYVTKKINFSRPSEMLRVMFAALIPFEADVEVYYKTGLSTDALFDEGRYFRAYPTRGYTKNDTNFLDMEFTVEDIPAFDSVMVKIVMKSSDKSKPPQIKDLRVIACAA